MKLKNIFSVVFIIVLAVAGWVLLKSNKSNLPVTDHEHKGIYYCPMHPHYTSDRPGKCPICGMDLVKKEETSKKTSTESSVSGYSSVSMDFNKQQLIGIKTAPVKKQTLTKTIHAYGYVAHDLELYNAQLEYIDAWRVYYAYLARRPILDQFSADWREYYKKEPSENRWRSDEKLKAQQRLIQAEYEVRHMGLGDKELEQLRQVKYGQPWVQPELLFFEKDQPFWIYAQVSESDLGFIAAGQKVVATIPAYNETVEGIVRNVTSFIDPETRTTKVRIELPTYRGELSVNMFVNVDLPVEMAEGLVIPREAIMDTGLNKIVFVQKKDGVFETRSIKMGWEGDGMVLVKDGLKENEMIVTSGNFLLDSESRLQGALAGGHNHD